MPSHIEVTCKLGKHIRTTKRNWEHIVGKHESVAGLEEQVKETLINPDYIRLSKEDKRIYLYYAPHGKYFLCVVCRHLNGDGFIITAYVTDKIKRGVVIYEAD